MLKLTVRAENGIINHAELPPALPTRDTPLLLRVAPFSAPSGGILSKTITVNCTAADYLRIDALTLFQGQLKKRTKADYAKIKKSILEYGFAAPFFVWKDNGTNKVLDGTGRLETLQQMAKDGYEIPALPVAYIDCKNDAIAKQVLLRINSQYGTLTAESVRDFMAGLEFKAEEISLPCGTLELVQEQKENIYTKKIETPVYQITGECPALSELVDKDKAARLTEQINKAEIPDDIKDFLRSAATRHYVFNYTKIAEYYAHAPAQVQELFEQSALVIIDFDKALENGYIRMTETLERFLEQGGYHEE